MKDKNTYSKLADFGRKLLDQKSLVEGLPLISKYAKEVMNAERCSIFIYDQISGELWTTLADGMGKIVIPKDKGIVGFTMSEKKPVVVNDPYSHSHFMSDVDKESGYITKNIITAPIFNSRREITGILQLLNKEEDFTNEDMKFMIFFAHYISGFLELTNIYLREDKNRQG
jgi:signal transduction protein with GAF and PtsI domain